MGLFDDSDGSAVKSNLPSTERNLPNTDVVSKELPKLVVGRGSEGVPSLKISTQPQYRYTKEETGQHPLTDRADAVLPPKFKGDHTFDPTTRVFEPSSSRSEAANERLISNEHHQNVNSNFRPQESAKDNAFLLQMPERNLFGGGSSGGDSSSLKGLDLSQTKSLSSLFEASRPKGNSDGSFFVIIIASLAVILSAIVKFLGGLFWPWMNQLSARRRRLRLRRR